MNASIGFIGGGNMAASLIGGLREAGCEGERIVVAEPDNARREQLRADYGVRTTGHNADTLAQDFIVLAVKPQMLHAVCRHLQPRASDSRAVFVSIAAGIRSASIDRWLGGGQAIVRCMPNTPALLQCGATGMFANTAVSTTQREQAEAILASVGLTVWVEDEALLDAITAVSGSGPAYYFLLMEAMTDAGVALGLDAGTAQQLVTQTALGAARMMAQSNDSAAGLRANVTSRGGTTEQAIRSFEQNGFRDMVKQALQAARDRSIELADELDQ